MRRARTWFWPGAPSAQLLVLTAAALTALPFLMTYVLHFGWWHASEETCREHELGCGISIHVAGTALVGALIFGMVFLRKEARAAARMRAHAKRHPERLFPWLTVSGLTGLAMDQQALRPWRRRVPFVEGILGRDRLVSELATDLDESGGTDPQVIVGDTAAGKTMVLVKLAHYVARRGQVPIAVSLRNIRDVDFERLARRAYLDGSTDDEGEAEKQWRWMRRRGLVTVIVDELEKADESVKPEALVQALRNAGQRRLRLVAASRPYALPLSYRRGLVDLAPLDIAEVRRDLRGRLVSSREAGLTLADAETTVQRVVDDAGADIAKTPYYLALARVLASSRALPAVAAERDVQFALLSHYRKALESGTVLGHAGVTVLRRQQACKDLEVIAFARLLGARSEQAISALLDNFGYGEVALSATLEYAQRLGVLRTRHDRGVRFAHPTTLAYFAGCFLSERWGDEAVWNRLFDQTLMTPGMVLTVYMANAAMLANSATPSPDVARDTCRRILARCDLVAERRPGDDASRYERVSLLVTAAAIASATPVGDDVTDEIVRSVDRDLHDPAHTGREHLRLVTRIKELPTTAAYKVLFTYGTTGTEYYVRRQATKALASGNVAAVEAVLPDIDKTMAAAARWRSDPQRADDNSDLLGQLDAVAWVLPSLRSVMRDSTLGERLDGYQHDLVGYARQLSRQRRLEAAVAQGLKLDAMRDTTLPPDALAIEMLGAGGERAGFWFSRILLLQAITVRAQNGSADAVTSSVRAARDDKHPFVRETAKLCLEALRTGRPDRYVWEDMTEVATRAPHELAPTTSRLIADVVLSLNLNEYGGPVSREAFGDADALPACMSKSRDRSEILGYGSLKDSCPFAQYQETGCLCPYTLDSPSGAIRRELSRAFCRHQRLNAGRVPWHRAMRVDRAKQFWLEMEDRARF